MADDVAVGEVGEDEVIALVHGPLHLLRHLRQAQLRLLVEGDALGGGDPQVVLAGEGLVLAAVEEEGHMGVLLRLGAVELPQSRLADDLRQGLHNLLRRKSDGQILELLMVHGHDDEAQILHIRPVEVLEIRVHEGVGQFDLPLAPAAAEDHLVPVLNFTYRHSALAYESQGLQIVVGLSGLISGLHGPGQGLAADIVGHKSLSFYLIDGKISSSWAKWLINRSGRLSSVTSWGFLPGYRTPMVIPSPAALAPTMSRARLSPT